MIEQKRGHHHKQTNSRPMKRGIWMQKNGGAVRNSDAYSSALSRSQLYTKTRLRPAKAVTRERDDVSERGLHFPTDPMKLFQVMWSSAAPGDRSVHGLRCSPRDVSVLVPIRPANPGHFKVPYQHRKRCKSVSAAQDRKALFHFNPDCII